MNLSLAESGRKSHLPKVNVITITAWLFVVVVLWVWGGRALCEERPDQPQLPPFVAVARSQPVNRLETLQNLSHLSEVQLMRAMAFVTESLGVTCGVCHLPTDYRQNEKAAKLRARIMLTLVQRLGQTYFAPRRVTCFTCHAGSTAPWYAPQGFENIPSLIPPLPKSQLPSYGYQNVQHLGHLAPGPYQQLMAFFVVATGAADCFDCHALTGFADDGKSTKQRARQMITMVQQLTIDFFNQQQLTCYTCHRGQKVPLQVPPTWCLTKP